MNWLNLLLPGTIYLFACLPHLEISSIAVEAMMSCSRPPPQKLGYTGGALKNNWFNPVKPCTLAKWKPNKRKVNCCWISQVQSKRRITLCANIPREKKEILLIDFPGIELGALRQVIIPLHPNSLFYNIGALNKMIAQTPAWALILQCVNICIKSTCSRGTPEEWHYTAPSRFGVNEGRREKVT